MTRTIPGHVHRPGLHCGSTALSDLVTFRGWDLDEPWCFGLGAGLGAFFAEGSFLSPSRMLYLRTATLEEDFFRRVGIHFEWRREPDPEEAWRALRASLDGGAPVLVRCDLAHLPYYASKTPFNGHSIVAWGYREEDRAVLVSDTAFAELQLVGAAELEAARTSRAIPFALERDAFFMPTLGEPPEGGRLARLALEALAAQAAAMLAPAAPPIGTQGVAALDELAASLPGWVDAPDGAWCARFAYQNIERRGTGGGGFRRLYAGFLERAAALHSGLAATGLSAEMQGLAEAWTELAHGLRAASDGPTPDAFAALARRSGDLAARERAFFTRAAGLAPRLLEGG